MNLARRRFLQLLSLFFVALQTPAVHAQSATQAIPPELRPWVDWVLTSDPDRACAFTDAGALCAWPGQLMLDLDVHGGRFELPYRMDRERDVAIVGSLGRWPSNVRVDGRETSVVARAGQPMVHLSEGAHRIEGSFAWQALPERIELPRELGLVALRVNGQAVPFPKREADGSVWLGESERGPLEVDELSLTVTRKIQDDAPVIVTTRLSLRVSGRAREIALGKVTLPDTAPYELISELPARLSPEGELRVQARAGIHRIEIKARTLSSPSVLQWRAPGPHWPAIETWVWQADDALRQVSITGVASVDPARTELDADWQSLPAYVLRDSTRMQFATLRRGEAVSAPNRVTLNRDMWLDLDGRGYTVRDQLSAEMKREWRLSLQHGVLGRVNDGSRDLLVTQDAHGDAGVELRSRNNQLVAEWREDVAQDELPAVAWSEDVQSLQAHLHLGPGWSVFAATGVDKISQSWVQDWDLFGFFFVLVLTLAFGKLFGLRMGLLALVTLVLTEHESDAPHALWFSLLVGAALLRALPSGAFRSITRVGFVLAAVTLAIVTVDFAVTQIRVALYPQLAEAAHNEPGFERLARMDMVAEEAPSPPAAPQAISTEAAANVATQQLMDESKAGGALADVLEGGKGKRNRYGSSSDWLSSKYGQDQDPDAVVQTGPGLPTWQECTWHLSWSGPVDRAQKIKLWLLPPSANRLLALLRVLFLCALAGLLLKQTKLGASKPDAGTSSAVLAALVIGFGVMSSVFVMQAHAQSPSRELLDELRNRVAPVPECRGACISLEELEVSVHGDQLKLRMQAHALEASALSLPGPVATWTPQTLLIDGHPASATLREDGFLLVRVEAGVHHVEASGPMPARDSLSLAMTELPHHTRIDADGWAVDGVRDDGQIDGSLLLSRLAKTSEAGALEGQALPEWLALERHLRFGPTWQIVTTLHRVSPLGAPVMAHIALLPGESIVDAAYEVKNGSVTVSLPRDGSEAQWTSTLRESPAINLVAAKGTRWSEQWVVDCTQMWRCELSGLAPLSDPTSNSWLPTFRPWPGETLRVALQKPKPAPGQSTTIDDVRLVVTPGQRIRNAELALRIRASRGGAHEVTLSEHAKVQALMVDGHERALQQSGAHVGFTLEPGTHQVNIEWQEATAVAFVENGTYVKLDGNAVNVRTAINVPSDRWLLWARGPSWGPAILFWGRVVLVLLLGFFLGRSGLTPLRGWEWMLLGLGLTQIDVPLAFIVVSWFFAMQQRSRMPVLRRWQHNLVQLALVFWTLVALGGLYDAVHQGLLMQPNMQVAGAGSTQDTLRWYSDRVSDVLPSVAIYSAPMWIWRVLMLCWALWLAARCIRWLPWALRCMREGGGWRDKAPKAPVVPAMDPTPTASTDVP